MAENKYLEMIEKLEEVTKWLKENSDAFQGTGRNICIYIGDDNLKEDSVSYVGDVRGLLRLYMHIEDALKENPEAVIKSMLFDLLKDEED